MLNKILHLNNNIFLYSQLIHISWFNILLHIVQSVCKVYTSEFKEINNLIWILEHIIKIPVSNTALQYNTIINKDFDRHFIIETVVNFLYSFII